MRPDICQHPTTRQKMLQNPSCAWGGYICCKTLATKDSQRESMRLDKPHEHTDTRPLPHYELVHLHGFAAQARITADPLPGNAYLHA